MTRDELEKFLMETIAPSLEEAWSERDASEQKLVEKERELGVERKAKKQERKARENAEREVASKDKEIEILKRALEDAKNTKATDNRNRFGKSSRKARHSVDKDFGNTDRSQEKDGYDGSEKATESEATGEASI